MRAKLIAFLALSLCVFSEVQPAEHALFVKESRNYGREGERGNKFRREFENRMFHHDNWVQRLYVTFYQPDVDQTLEVYRKPDGSPCLAYTSAAPSVSKAIDAGQWGYDSAKLLKAVRVTRNEIALPSDVAKEIELLWRTILPDSLSEREEAPGTIYLHRPGFVALLASNNSVRIGRVQMAAIGTPAYDSFVQIVEDLLKACNGKQKDQILSRLPPKIERLRALLKKA